MIRLHRERSLREELGKAAFAFAREECSSLKVAEQSVVLYEQLKNKFNSTSLDTGLDNPLTKTPHSRLKAVVDETSKILQMLDGHLSEYGPAAKERAGYDTGYAAGLSDGQDHGYQRGQEDILHNSVLMKALFRLQGLKIQKPD
jgi:flagellar biosynthesis/type III secretory pathway protein FliH